MRSLLLIPILGLAVVTFGQGAVVPFTENNGQWPEQVLYRANLPGGALFVEAGAFTYVQVSGLDLHRHAQPEGGTNAQARGHAWKVHFEGGMAQGHEGHWKQPHYENFFIGNDPSRWGAGCGVFGQVLLKNVWPGIDIRIDGRQGMKYDVLVAPGADPALVRMRYEGPDGLALNEQDLHVTLSTGMVVEEAPIVFNLSAGQHRHPVPCHYSLENSVLRFELPMGYDQSLPLVIDPVLAFASYSGSTADNFGFTATYDEAGHLYGGGVVFGAGYPTNVGAFDPTFNGGTVDVGISKWAANGATLVWSTYLGGTGNEAPHSMVTNLAGELYVMGSTGSANYPTTAGCFSAVFQGGPSVTFSVGYGFDFPQGADIFVTHLNAAGNALLGSTYVGGSGSDGVNTSAIAHNYGDAFRGEVALDPDNNPVVITSTSSTNMPTTAGAPMGSFGGGGLDAFVFRLDPSLSTMLWATYHGGSGADSGHGVQFDSAGEVFITGGTNSSNLPLAGSPLNPSNSGGSDAFVARFSMSGNTLLSATYLGTNLYDQAFFVQLDTDDEVYVLGQTRGNYPVSPGVYSNPGSSQFIHKLSHDLSTSIWSTRIGNGSNTQDLSPSAFLVSDCDQIYFSGWGGATNNLGSPNGSTTTGSPVTPDAFQATTNGSDFYLMVLDPDAAGLNYATFFGGSNTNDHVDGGTSRFDKNGTVYQAVCAGCGGQSSFPTSPGAYSNSNNSFNCNLGVIKFDLSQPLAVIDINGPSTICFPEEVQFVNNSIGGTSYQWWFGDGATSTDFEPIHTYTTEGTFTVTLVLTDDLGCADPDTATIEVVSIPTPQASIEPVGPLCPGGSVQLFASPADAYEWFPATGLSDPTVQDPVASPTGSTTYFLVITTGCGNDTSSVDIEIADPQGGVMPDTAVCLGSSVLLSATGGVEFLWSPAATLDDPASATPTATPLVTTTYAVALTTLEGCLVVDSITVNVIHGLPGPVLNDTAICLGSSVQLFGPDADQHSWQPAAGLSSTTVQSPTVEPVVPTLYIVLASNLCGSILDSAYVDVVTVIGNAWPDTLVCPGNPVQLHADGGTTYNWSPGQGLDNTASSDPVATIYQATTYTVTIMDDLGCTGIASVSIGLLPPPQVLAWDDQVIDLGDRVEIHSSGPGTPQWEPSTWLDCSECATTGASPETSMVYTVTYSDGNGCSASASVLIILNGTLFVPNTFTPDGDGINDLFGALGSELATFRMLIFNRWGELICELDHVDQRWDGTYKGVPSPIDTYVWRIEARELSGTFRKAIGHVNLVR